jgi:hypothetical protein
MNERGVAMQLTGVFDTPCVRRVAVSPQLYGFTFVQTALE